MMKKFLIAFVLMMITVSAGFAAETASTTSAPAPQETAPQENGPQETVIVWNWDLTDPNVIAFRFQVNGEEKSAWRVVDTSVRSYSLRGVEPGKAYTLYLQQSYDRLRWSNSSVSTVVAEVVEVPVVEEEPVEEPVETTEAVPSDASATTPEAAPSTDVAPEAAPSTEAAPAPEAAPAV